MRSTVIGVVLAVAFVAAMFALNQLEPHVSAPLYVQAASDVKPGFVGMKRLGRWVLVCPKASAAGAKTAIPFSLSPDPKTSAAAAAQDQNPMARCHITLQYPQKKNPKALLMAVNFRYTPDQKQLAMVIIFPSAWAQKGDNLAVIVGKRAQFPVPVRQCVPNSYCTASGFLDQSGQNLILSVKQAVVRFPAKKDAKSLIAPVPLMVLKDALAALKRADG
jgi:hypothetical protein